MSNSIKFSHPQSEVLISYTKDDGLHKIQIKDFGVGIKQENIAKLFDYTNQIRQLGTKGEKGNGLGLFLCNEVLRMHKGKIQVESEEGKGSTFTILLPE